MKKVLLIGDSIRLGYRGEVAKLLEGEAQIQGPDDNCRFSAYTLFNVAQWATDSDYDVIQWNNGQWDTCYMTDGKIHTPLDMYLEYQERIAGILLKQTRRLVFATTTPVWPEMFDTASRNPRKNEDICEYNLAAAEMLSSMGVGINDLHACVATDIKKYISDDMVHLTDVGNQLCAKRVADMIEAD